MVIHHERVTHLTSVCLCRREHEGHLGRKAGALPGALGDAALDDARLRHQHIHQIAPGHQIKQEVQVQLVLRARKPTLLVQTGQTSFWLQSHLLAHCSPPAAGYRASSQG